MSRKLAVFRQYKLASAVKIVQLLVAACLFPSCYYQYVPNSLYTPIFEHAGQYEIGATGDVGPVVGGQFGYSLTDAFACSVSGAWKLNTHYGSSYSTGNSLSGSCWHYWFEPEQTFQHFSVGIGGGIGRSNIFDNGSSPLLANEYSRDTLISNIKYYEVFLEMQMSRDFGSDELGGKARINMIRSYAYSVQHMTWFSDAYFTRTVDTSLNWSTSVSLVLFEKYPLIRTRHFALHIIIETGIISNLHHQFDYVPVLNAGLHAMF